MPNRTHVNHFISQGQSLPISLESGVIETFVPGFSIIRRLIQAYFGIDLNNVATVFLIAVMALGALRYCLEFIWDRFESWLTCSVTISHRTDLFNETKTWMSEQKFVHNSRHLLADDCNKQEPVWLQTETGNQGYDAITPPSYTLGFGHSHFWHKGQLIRVVRNQSDYSKSQPERLVLSCYGLSSTPLKNLLLDCKRFGADYSRANTKIHVASDEIGDAFWGVGNTRPSRSVDTVYMRQSVKDDLLDDLREYLDPFASKFYARRGIPYRRGFLFHGPPGTGKSSMAFALASYFGLSLYTANLKDNQITDRKLAKLFVDLPSRCIVLLEDVDAAGLAKRILPSDDDDKSASDGDFTRVSASPSPSNQNSTSATEDSAPSKITLSGLLNAIDGVASTEGRVLIMTTNDPEALDAALIRPGRIDKQVHFGYATRQHTLQIFRNMYSRDTAEDSKTNVDLRTTSPASKPLLSDEKEDMVELEDLSSAFADGIPENSISPAEIQGFLLTHRKDAKKALEDVPAWCNALLAARKARKNIIKRAEGKQAPKGLIDATCADEDSV